MDRVNEAGERRALPERAGRRGLAIGLAGAIFAAFAVAALAAPLPVSLVAGTGEEGHGGDGGPATQAQLWEPVGIDRAGDGSVYIADAGPEGEAAGRVRVVSPQGTISTALAPGPASPVGEEFQPLAVAATPGGMVVADGELEAIFTRHGGDVARIAGGTEDSHDPEEPDPDPTEGEGGTCDAELIFQMDVDFDGLRTVNRPGGGTVDRPAFLVGLRSTNQEVAPPGEPSRVLSLRPVPITTGCALVAFERVAGGGADPGPGAIAPSGDGQDATDVYLNHVTAVASLHGQGGGFLVATAGSSPLDCRVRRVSPGGVVTTVAGNGLCVGSTAEGPATGVALGAPLDVEPLPDGGFLVAVGTHAEDAAGFLVRRVAPDGTITTIETDDPFANQISPLIFAASGLAAEPDGSLLAARPSGPPDAGLGGRILRVGAGAAAPLTTTLGRNAYAVRSGKKLTVRFAASRAAGYRLDVFRGARRVRRWTGQAASGSNKVARVVRLRPRRYRLKLSLTAAGELATDSAKLKVKPK
jgi:hypothetical protein